MKVEIQDLFNAAGIGFEFLLASLITNLLNASLEPMVKEHAEGAREVCRRLSYFVHRQPAAPMPINVIGSFVNQLGPRAGGEPRYAALVVSVLGKSPFDPLEVSKKIEEIEKGYS